MNYMCKLDKEPAKESKLIWVKWNKPPYGKQEQFEISWYLEVTPIEAHSVDLSTTWPG